jgi:hypothetical protein
VTDVDLRPDNTRPVQVLHTDGRWYEGELQAYRQIDRAWSGCVRYTIAIAAHRVV